MAVRRLLVPFVVALASCHRAPVAATPPEPVAASPTRTPPTTQPSAPAPRTIASADRRILDRGVAAMEAGDSERARLIFVGLLDRYPQDEELSRLHAAAVESGKRDEARREAMRPVALEVVPLRRHKIRDAPIRQGQKPKLVLSSKARNEIIDVEAWFKTNELRRPTWRVPTPRGEPGSDLPPWIPLQVEGQRIVQAMEDGDHVIALYAKTYWRGRVLLVFDTERDLVAAYDFSAWSGPEPRKDASDRRILWAVVREGVLFVSSGHFGYAKESGGRTGYLSAIDLKSGELLWRSDPLVANANNFLYEDGYIISGYGFTAEPDFLFVVDARTGETVTRMKLRKGPDFILKKEAQVFVRTYDTDYVFDLR